MSEDLIQLAECIGRHIAHIKRDGLPNSQHHLEKIDQDARAIHAITSGQEYSVTLHGLER